MNGKWILIAGDIDQYPLEVEHYAGLIAITVGDVTTEITPAEARSVAASINYHANLVANERGAGRVA